MNLSRFWGAAITCGTLFGGGMAHAQVNYYTASGMARPSAPSATVARLPDSYPQANPQTLPAYSAYPAYPTTTYPTTAYPSTGGYGYSVASLPTGGATHFSGPTNAPVTHLPYGSAGASTGLVGHTPSPEPALNLAPAFGGSVMTTPGGNMGSYGIGPGANDPSGITPLTGGQAAPGYGSGVGSQAFQPFAAAGACDTGGACCPAPSCWYGGVYGMVLSRNPQEHYTFSYDTGNESIQYTDQKDADTGWGGGFAAVAGRYFNCGCNAFEMVYWGWFPEEGSTYTYDANALVDIGGIFNWSSLTYNGANMDTFVDGAQVHALFHESEAHNVELNLLSFSSGYGSGPHSLRYSLLAGLRYFHFRDHLTFRSDPNDTAFTGEVDEVYYDIKTINDLVGFQLGGVGTYCVGPRFSLNAGSKVGVFGNYITHNSVIGGPAGVAVINNGPNIGQAFNVSNNKTDVAFLAELFLGCGYCVTQHFSVSAGYRAVALTGLAMPSDQIYPDLRGINDLYTVESPSSMILHGAYFGGQFIF